MKIFIRLSIAYQLNSTINNSLFSNLRPIKTQRSLRNSISTKALQETLRLTLNYILWQSISYNGCVLGSASQVKQLVNSNVDKSKIAHKIRILSE